MLLCPLTVISKVIYDAHQPGIRLRPFNELNARDYILRYGGKMLADGKVVHSSRVTSAAPLGHGAPVRSRDLVTSRGPDDLRGLAQAGRKAPPCRVPSLNRGGTVFPFGQLFLALSEENCVVPATQFFVWTALLLPALSILCPGCLDLLRKPAARDTMRACRCGPVPTPTTRPSSGRPWGVAMSGPITEARRGRIPSGQLSLTLLDDFLQSYASGP
ncbi:hypothetical protein HPB47_005890 [Ixodes persulcatus]|uniref:Uncharacterized protein n=1 Tax=Ixodes persulcatus TaxID=34615 RepID=A0AC60PC26_IXOPE|nr:hypothetical protein HPB47_005890 [Ixodes persulcatus]